MTSQSMKQVDDMMRRAVVERIFPGAVLMAAKKEKIFFFEAYGMADLFSRRPMTQSTIFDLASLTKPLATALAILLLVQEEKLALEDRLGKILDPLRGTDKEGATVADLLDHSGGLPAWRPYFQRLRGLPPASRKAALRTWLAAEPLEAPPGTRTVYSDLGFMILDWAVEAVSGVPLDRFVGDRIYGPLGLVDLFFPGIGPSKTDSGRYAATELCPWRKRLLCGEVHDDNAWSVGGVAGHAGLFGTAAAVHQLLGALQQAHDGDGSLFEKDLIGRFFRPRRPGGRALGFDAPEAAGSAAGRLFPSSSVGHLGFTGTSFWLDPASGVQVILLTNRVHPARFDTRIRDFRPRLHDAVMKCLPLR